jgi:hypothetical protein
MNGRKVIDIPVYRLSPEQRSIELSKIKNDRTNPLIVYKEWGIESNQFFWNHLTEQQQLDSIENWSRDFDYSDEARGWQFNDVIGYISIFVDKDQVKAEYWFMRGTIRREMRNRVFQYRGSAFEIWVLYNDTSDDIYKQILRDLERLKTKKPFKGRYIDMESFQVLGEYINWLDLVKHRI